MDEIMKAPGTGLTPLSMLAEEARVYSENIIMNTLNLGRVLTEAKQQVKHGEWGDWVAIHAGMSVRSAQTFMQVYSRFGGKPAFALVDKSKLYKMLALPEGTEDTFIAEHDVGKAVNPRSCEGQIEGGVVMSMGYALREQYPIDENCKPIEKYGELGLFRAHEIPKIVPIVVDKPGLDVACGAIGIGEITSIPTAPAIADAYFRYDGERRTKLPLANTPYERKGK